MPQVKEVGSGAAQRERRERLIDAVWRLDRWGRSLPDLVTTLKELAEPGVSLVLLTEVADRGRPRRPVGKLFYSGVSRAEIARRLSLPHEVTLSAYPRPTFAPLLKAHRSSAAGRTAGRATAYQPADISPL
jgi:hypothetical protein